MNRTPSRTALLTVALLVAAATSAAAQGARFGLKGGVALANLYGDAVGNVEMRTGGTGGLFVDVRTSTPLSFQLEGLYTQKGAQQTELIDFGTGPTLASGTWQYDYVEAVALLKATFGSGGVRIGLFGGPYYGFLMSAKAVGDGGEAELEDLTKESDVGVVLGGTLEFAGGFLFDLRYSLGMSEIDEPPLSDTFMRKHNVIQAMLGFAAGG